LLGLAAGHIPTLLDDRHLVQIGFKKPTSILALITFAEGHKPTIDHCQPVSKAADISSIPLRRTPKLAVIYRAPFRGIFKTAFPLEMRNCGYKFARVDLFRRFNYFSRRSFFNDPPSLHYDDAVA
jgi:hypothetical protein